ncbi:MAG: hypothetical protein AB7S38_28805 [Vulcanimicrobiota bacterium]
MKSYMRTRSSVPPEAFALFERATELVASVYWDTAPGGDLVRCHELARAVGRVLNLEVVDGQFHAWDHSWLIVPRCVLDVYAVGQEPMVLLVDELVAKRAYKPLRGRTDIRLDVVDLLVEKMCGLTVERRARG